MKRIIYIILLLPMFLSLMSFGVTAQEYSLDSIEEKVSDDLFSSMDEDIKDALGYFGVDKLDFEKIYSISFSDILSYFTPQIKDKAASVFKTFFQLLSAVMILCIFSVLLKESGLEKTVMLLGNILIIIISASGINSTLNACLSALKISSGFMISFVPILTLLISLSGNPASALAYNTAVLGFAEVLSAVISNGLVDFLGCFFCLAIAFSLNETVKVSKLINAVNKTVSLFLGFSGSIFAGVLSIKNIMAVSADSLSVKGIRFLISSFIPVIGSSISEAYSSLLGSINLIKGSVAVIGIIAVIIINLPVIAETFLYYISFSALSYISDICGCHEGSEILKAICCGMRILLLLVIFEMFLLVISTGIMLTFRGG